MELSSARLARNNYTFPSVVRAGDCLALSSSPQEKESLQGVLSPCADSLCAEALSFSFGTGKYRPYKPFLPLLSWEGGVGLPVILCCKLSAWVIGHFRPTWVARAVCIPPWSKPRQCRKAQVLLGAQRPWTLHPNHSALFCCQHTELGT